MSPLSTGGTGNAGHEILGRLAVGGMAELYLARTRQPDGQRELVVLKRILPHLAEDPDFTRMFRDEAFLAATLQHPNVVRVHDIGQDGDNYFFTMEYVHGENARTLIKAAQQDETPLALEHVVEIIKGVCAGLHYAHERTDSEGNPLCIVHRDVSPTNVLISVEGDVKIVDFGIAKAAAATHVTRAGMLKGKASYMSPEQCRAAPVDRRSDVFAIGILLYELTTLTRLFRGDNEVAVLHQILTGTIETPSTRVSNYDPALEAIVMKALAEQPDDRYGTAMAMKDALEEFGTLRGLKSSKETLGQYLRDLCGDKPYPWDEDEDELEAMDMSGTGLPTSMGPYESHDIESDDTQVNRLAPNRRTMIPQGPPPKPLGSPPVGRGPRQPVARPASESTKRGSSWPIGRTVPMGLYSIGDNKSSSGPQEAAPSDEPPAGSSPTHGLDEPTAPLTSPFPSKIPVSRRPGRRGPTPRGGTPRPGPKPPGQPLVVNRGGSTLPGAAGGLGGPQPARSGRTVPSMARTESTGDASASGDSRPSMEPVGVPPRSSDLHAESIERTQALTPQQVQELARLGQMASPPSRGHRSDDWSGPGVERTEISVVQPLPTATEVDESARTMSLSRINQTVIAGPSAADSAPPHPWPPSPPPAEDALTSTQRVSASDYRVPSAAYPIVDVDLKTPTAGDLNRHQMRSPSPRPAPTPRSLWVPLLLLVIVGLLGVGAWLLLSIVRVIPFG